MVRTPPRSSKGLVSVQHTFLSSASEATHQRHALDRYTFRQSARGLTIHRGATSPILDLRHSCYSTFTIHGALLFYQGRSFDYYITPADLLQPYQESPYFFTAPSPVHFSALSGPCAPKAEHMTRPTRASPPAQRMTPAVRQPVTDPLDPACPLGLCDLPARVQGAPIP